MPSRTQIVCLHEGEKGRSIDPIFIRALPKALDPTWIKPWPGNNIIRTTDCGGRSTLIKKFPGELRACLARGGDTTLMVWADLDHDMTDGEELKASFWEAAQQAGITKDLFDLVVFAFAKDRIENWIEFILTGQSDESKEGPRQQHGAPVAKAEKLLAQRCLTGAPPNPPLCSSPAWSCRNWRDLVKRMAR